MYGDVIRVELWPCVIPPYHMLASCQGGEKRRDGEMEQCYEECTLLVQLTFLNMEDMFSI